MGGKIKKIYYFHGEAGFGGAERCLLDLLAEARHRLPGFTHHVINFSLGPLLDRIRELGIECTCVPMPESLARAGEGSSPLRIARGAAGWWAFCRRLRQCLEQGAPDLIYSSSIKGHLLLQAANRQRRPLLWHLHDFVGARTWTKRALDHLGGRPCRIVVPSAALARDIEVALRKPGVQVIANGVDTRHFSPGPACGDALDRLAGWDSGDGSELRVGMVATFAHWKGHELFLRAVARLQARLPHARFYIVGGPLYRSTGSQVSLDQLRAIAHSLGIPNRLGFIGFQEDPAPIYRALDIVVHASTRPEPFGRTVVEAMACARPVVASALGGSGEIFCDGVDALSFRTGDENSLAATIERLAGEPALRASLGENARRTVLSRFSRERYGEAWADVLRSASNDDAVVVAMGFHDDQWRSSGLLTEGLAARLGSHALGGRVIRHRPLLGRRPRWFDRRLRYARTLPEGRLLCLMDHSYGDALLGARRRFRALVVVVHDLAFWHRKKKWNLFFRRQIAKGLRQADRVIAVSHATARALEKELGVRAHAIIAPAFPIEVFTYCGAPRDETLLLHVGSVDERKGFDRLLRLLAALPGTYRLVHAGEELNLGHRNLAERLGVAKRVQVFRAPSRGTLIALYQSVGALVIASRYEGFGMPAVEARLCGTRVALSRETPAIEVLVSDAGTLSVDFDDEPVRVGQRVAGFSGQAVVLADRSRFGWELAAAQFLDVFQDADPESRYRDALNSSVRLAT